MKIFRLHHLSGWQWLLGCGCAALASLTLNAGESVYPGDLSPETYYNDAPNLEFGTVFRPTLPGRITQVRVFALAEETGSHSVRIWRNSPQALLFSTNWNFGGQQSAWIALAIPALQLESGVDYTVAISAPAEGWYPINIGYFNTAGNNGLHLAFPQGAGVFSDTAGVRPTTSENSAYLRDVVFDPAPGFLQMVIQGNGVEIARGDTSPSPDDGTAFGEVTAGSTPELTFTINNIGQSVLNLTGTPAVVFTGSGSNDFSVVTQPSALIPTGGSASFTIRFNPSATGSRAATVSIANSATPNNPFTFTVGGSVPDPMNMAVQGNSVAIARGDTSPSLEDGTQFGLLALVGASQDQTFTILNSGLNDLELPGSSPVAIKGPGAADFRVLTQPTGPVASGGSATFTVRFDPAVRKPRLANLMITNSDTPGIPFTFAIGGLVSGGTNTNSVNITLAAANKETGLYLCEPADGITTVVTKGGSSARSTMPINGQPGFMYFSTDPAFVYDAGATPLALYLTLEYFDEGTDTFQIEYDTEAGETTVLGKDSIVRKNNTQKWVVRDITLPEVKFAKRQSGMGDFRINDNNDGAEVIRKVSIAKTPPIALRIKLTDLPPKLDGTIDDPVWQAATPFLVDRGAQDVIQPTKWKSTNDFSLDARFAWDTNYFYFLYNVTDDVPFVTDPNPGMQFNGDGIELYFGFDQSNPSRGEGHYPWEGHYYLDATDYQITITASQAPNWAVAQVGVVIPVGPQDPATNLVITARSGGYVMEGRIPWALLLNNDSTSPDFGKPHTAPVLGQRTGFNMFGNDGDNPAAPKQEKAMSFNGTAGANSWGIPAHWTTVLMVGADEIVQPKLTIARQVDGKIRLSWPATAAGFTLQQTTVLPGTWVGVNAQVQESGAEKFVVIQPSGNTVYYRLSQ